MGFTALIEITVATCAGASKQLAIVLEGESLLNDGAAIVLFGVFNNLATPGVTLSGMLFFHYDLVLYFKTVFQGPCSR